MPMSLSIQALTKRVPVFAAVAAALVGLVNIASTLTPNIRWRGHLLLEFEPVEAIRLFHALSLPAGAALLLVAPYLAKRRRRAMQTAVALMLALGVFDLLKGLDFEETILTWGVAVALIVSRDAFTVRHDPNTLRSAVWRVPVLALVGLAVAMFAVWTGSHASFGNVATETFDLLRYQPGPMHFHHHIPIGVHMLEIGTLLMVAYVIFRPLAAPRTPPSPAARRVASDLVRAHGADTLAFFKLRADGHYIFSEDRRAFVAYAIENGVLLLSGDPVGPARRDPRAARAGPAVRRRPRPEARRARRQRGSLPAVRGARPPHDVRGGRGSRRRQSLLARGPTDSQGAPVGDTPHQGRIRGRAARAARARPDHDRTASKRSSSSVARAPPSAASRWRWTRSRASTITRRSSCWHATKPARSAASCISSPATAAPRCRCRSCGATRRRPTG